MVLNFKTSNDFSSNIPQSSSHLRHHCFELKGFALKCKSSSFKEFFAFPRSWEALISFIASRPISFTHTQISHNQAPFIADQHHVWVIPFLNLLYWKANKYWLKQNEVLSSTAAQDHPWHPTKASFTSSCTNKYYYNRRRDELYHNHANRYHPSHPW